METCFNYCYDRNHNDNVGWFSSDEQRWITKIHKLKEQYPDEVIIKAEPEDNDGCIYCKLPQNWLKIQPPRQLSDEAKQRITEQLAKGRAKNT